jgi:hypothetical protein
LKRDCLSDTYLHPNLIDIMSQSTNRHPATKRSRLTDKNETSAPPDTSPTKAAQDRIASAVSSLNVHTQKLAKVCAVNVFTAHTNLRKQQKLLSTLADADFVPRSLRVSFQLSGSKLITGHQGFIDAEAATKQALETYQSTVKTQIIAVANLELTALQTEKVKVITTSLFQYSRLYILALSGKPCTNEKLIELLCMPIVHSTEFADVLSFLKTDGGKRFFADLTSIEITNDTLDVALAPPPNGNDIQYFVRCCSALFIAPATAYNKAEDVSTTVLALRKLTEVTISETATEDVAMALETEKSVDSVQLQAIIASSIKKETASLRATIDKLSKNSTRGAAPSSASLKKKSASETTVTFQPDTVAKKSKKKTTTKEPPASSLKKNPRYSAPAAAASANATPAAKSNSTQRPGKGKLKKKKQSK